MSQSVKRLGLTNQVMISRFMSLSPAPGSVLTARSLEPALDSVSSSLSLPLPCSHCLSLSLSLSLSQINIKIFLSFYLLILRERAQAEEGQRETRRARISNPKQAPCC